jgi:predicted dienelactone hydrolase
MQHIGSDATVWKSVDRAKRIETLKNAAGLKATVNRLLDVRFVIDQLEQWATQEGHPLAGQLDLDHIGLSGHSYGAVTTLGLMGKKHLMGRSFGDSRIDAFLPMSPQPGKRPAPDQAFGHIKAPVLCMTGTEDGSPIDPNLKPETRRLVYAALPAGDKYQLVFEGGHHFAFGSSGGWKDRNRNPKHHPTIQKISTRFWNAYLKGDEEAKAWLQSEAPREECGMDPKDVWEWK